MSHRKFEAPVSGYSCQLGAFANFCAKLDWHSIAQKLCGSDLADFLHSVTVRSPSCLGSEVRDLEIKAMWDWSIDDWHSCQTPRKGQEVWIWSGANSRSGMANAFHSFPKDDKKKPPHLTAALGTHEYTL